MIWQLAYGANGNMIRLATMARFAVTGNTRVYILRVPERRSTAANGSCRVADRTILICRQMIKCLTGTDIAVMTRHAVIHNACMIKSGRYKTRGGMAHGTILSGWQVVNELTHCDHIIVAICAKCRRINITRTMTKDTASESTGGMANTTILARRHVVE